MGTAGTAGQAARRTAGTRGRPAPVTTSTSRACAPWLRSGNQAVSSPSSASRPSPSAGALWLGSAGLDVHPEVILPVVAIVIGAIFFWSQLDDTDTLGARRPVRWIWLVVGLGLTILGLVGLLVRGTNLTELWQVAGAVLAALVGVAVLSAPWILRLWSNLRLEQAARIRATERADIAAHLHDSVLQTLALIQRQSGDAATVARLARAQERQLRSYLYDEDARAGTLGAALTAAMGEVEDLHGVPVQLVVTGDRPMDAHLDALVKAVREATWNAVRHASPPVSTYVEVGPDAVEAFVRDHGAGFDLDTVPDDRAGVRESIIGRMERHGGTARIRRRADGTEVELRLPVGSRPSPSSPPRRPARRSLRPPPQPPSAPGPAGPADAGPPDPGAGFMTDPRTIRIVIVDDHHMFRTGVRAELTSLAATPRAGAFRSRSPARPERSSRPCRSSRSSSPTSCSSTSTCPAATGTAAPTSSGRAPGSSRRPAVPVRFLALSVSDAAEDVIAVIRAGARGYVTKTISAEELLTAIGRVADGDAVFSPRLAGFVLDAFGAAAGEVAEIDEELDRLSAREREVMRLIARGYQYKEVAKELFISVKTVETHVSSVLRKLQLSSPARADRLGHGPPPPLTPALAPRRFASCSQRSSPTARTHRTGAYDGQRGGDEAAQGRDDDLRGVGVHPVPGALDREEPRAREVPAHAVAVLALDVARVAAGDPQHGALVCRELVDVIGPVGDA